MKKFEENHRRELSRAIASWFVRKDGKYYRIDAPGAAISLPDVKQASVQRMRREFPHINLTGELLREVFGTAFSLYHQEPTEMVATWSGQVISRPGDDQRLLLNDGFATINLWRKPVYRDLKVNQHDWGPTGAFLEWIIPDDATRRQVIDWIAWNLQNEGDRPTWCLFLHSKAKGTGKSQLCRILEALFGEHNTTSQNGISKLTGRFNVITLMSKLVICEEVKLKQGSNAANDLKTLISEPRLLVERKGQEAYQTQQNCCFVFTSNHPPLWLEADDRRFFIVDIDHEGHASGPRTEAFQALVKEVQQQIEDPAALGALYNALIQSELDALFNAKSLNTKTHCTPIMKMIQEANRQVSTERLEELLNEIGQGYITQTALVHYFQKSMHANVETIRHKMFELGWHKAQAKWGGVDYQRVIWVGPGYSIQRGNVIAPDGTGAPIRDDVEIGL
ncbi:primase-helicase family protein [Aestuariicoccus sp. MJ-SS9]|uniref:primase-helicase family protein n=1 Tax=Aestuariicoccus sp. MJ-SS9 TaxID=3079855 RepID=UPI002907C165|nr:DUF5906 domain-containing protein [Aestuariicoccus sp. MJ-SS9]MDU8914034.1 DUF5906 domain-containing protein [Aestuariicoccus sp. MJ-SS9]